MYTLKYHKTSQKQDISFKPQSKSISWLYEEYSKSKDQAKLK